MAGFETLAELELRVEKYELEDRDRNYGEFTRALTVVHLQGGGE
jgi:hypothetical protein